MQEIHLEKWVKMISGGHTNAQKKEKEKKGSAAQTCE